MGRQWRPAPEELVRLLAGGNGDRPARRDDSSPQIRERAQRSLTKVAPPRMTDISGITSDRAQSRVSKPATTARAP